MTSDNAFDRFLARFPATAPAAYVVVLALLLLSIWTAVSDLLERQRTVDAAADMLARLEGRKPRSQADGGGATGPVPGRSSTPSPSRSGGGRWAGCCT